VQDQYISYSIHTAIDHQGTCSPIHQGNYIFGSISTLTNYGNDQRYLKYEGIVDTGNGIPSLPKFASPITRLGVLSMIKYANDMLQAE
jgi:hypothetical protein